MTTHIGSASSRTWPKLTPGPGLVARHCTTALVLHCTHHPNEYVLGCPGKDDCRTARHGMSWYVRTYVATATAPVRSEQRLSPAPHGNTTACNRADAVLQKPAHSCRRATCSAASRRGEAPTNRYGPWMSYSSICWCQRRGVGTRGLRGRGWIRWRSSVPDAVSRATARRSARRIRSLARRGLEAKQYRYKKIVLLPQCLRSTCDSSSTAAASAGCLPWPGLVSSPVAAGAGPIESTAQGCRLPSETPVVSTTVYQSHKIRSIFHVIFSLRKHSCRDTHRHVLLAGDT